jgi:hypothetical protein
VGIVAIGRCPGCGLSDKDSDLVREHTRYCAKYAALWLRHPDRAIDPEAEFIRWRDEERPAEREGRREEVIAEADRRRAVQASRWATPPDILEE